MISPTGKGTRGSDKYGSGNYGAGRGNRIHRGADYICVSGQDVVSPIFGTVVRIARPYKKIGYSGLLIRNSGIEIKLFYLKPSVKIVGTNVNAGDKIGIAQDISKKYPGMIPHIHLQIDSIDPELLINLP